MAEDFLFSLPGAKPEGQRYSVRPPARDWTLQEEFALLPVILACPSDGAYLQACKFLCETLDRVPTFGPTVRPTIADVVRESVSIVERRSVTELLTGRMGVHRFAQWVFDGHRTGTPLTHGEKQRILKPYVRKMMAGTPRIEETELLCLLERDPKDAKLVHDYIIGCQLEREEPDEERKSPIPPPCRGFTTFPVVSTLSRLIRAFVSAEPDDEQAVIGAWNELNGHLRT